MVVFNSKKLEQEIKSVEDYAVYSLKREEGIDNLLNNLKTLDAGVYEHSLNVCHIATALGLRYKLNLHELIGMAQGSILHDIGKLYLNEKILYKPYRLNEDERIFIETHTNYGYKILREAGANGMTLDICKSHHEKLNGKGYPDGLTGDKISIHVQLVTVADIFDALISERCYKKAVPTDEAIRLLEDDKGLNQVAVSILKDLEPYGRK